MLLPLLLLVDTPPAEAPATIDPWVTLLVGALGAALLGLLGATIASRREHAKWVREQRMEAYRGFLRATETVWPSQSSDAGVWREYMDGMGTTLADVRLVGPKAVSEVANAHLDASLTFAGALRQHPTVGGVPHPALREPSERVEMTRDSFVAVAQKELGIRP